MPVPVAAMLLGFTNLLGGAVGALLSHVRYKGFWVKTQSFGIFNYLPLLEMALLEMGLLGLVLRFCHRLLSGATHLGLLVTWQATSPIQRGIGRGNDPCALPFP
jgi:hypothetical protein